MKIKYTLASLALLMSTSAFATIESNIDVTFTETVRGACGIDVGNSTVGSGGIAFSGEDHDDVDIADIKLLSNDPTNTPQFETSNYLLGGSLSGISFSGDVLLMVKDNSLPAYGEFKQGESYIAPDDGPEEITMYVSVPVNEIDLSSTTDATVQVTLSVACM